MTENAFHFLQFAKVDFQFGDMDTKKEILSALGLNHRLKSEELFIDIHAWVIAIKSAEISTSDEIERFELNKNLMLKGEKAPNGAFLPSLCAVISDVRTALISAPSLPYIPNLSEYAYL